MDGVGTPIIERPRPLSGHDTPNPTHHTLNYEEPVCGDGIHRARPLARHWLRYRRSYRRCYRRSYRRRYRWQRMIPAWRAIPRMSHAIPPTPRHTTQPYRWNCNVCGHY